MVLSQLLAPLLAKALGSFVKPECLEEDSLRVGLWKGHVRLSNICLRDDLLDVLGLPITLRYARYVSPCWRWIDRSIEPYRPYQSIRPVVMST